MRSPHYREDKIVLRVSGGPMLVIDDNDNDSAFASSRDDTSESAKKSRRIPMPDARKPGPSPERP